MNFTPAITLLGEPTPIREGWRYEVFGKDAEALLRGDVALRLDAKGRVTLER